MNIMRVQDIRRVNGNRLEYSYTVEGEWSKYFEPGNPMWVEYTQLVDQVPDSVAVLPLVGNVIVLASLMDADIYVDEIDRDFYECIEEFIQGYDNIMPDHVHFKHRDIVHANKIVHTPLSQTEQEENLLFFSGGVDATFSLISHLEEKPALVTIWGADIPWDNEESWKQAIGFNQEVADRYDLKMLPIRSNFRMSMNNDNLETYSMELVQDWWWSAFHHSVAMMCLAAPISFGKRKKLYFASSCSSKDRKEWGDYVLASDPQIDNHVRFCGCQVVHDGYDFSRFDKIKHICDFYENEAVKPYLRVCYLSNSGQNCGICEKCACVIMSMMIIGADPTAYGFHFEEEELPRYFAAGVQEMARSEKYACLSLYKDIQTAYREKYSIEEVPPVLRTFYETDLEDLADFLHVPNNECIAKEKAIKQTQEQLYRQIGQLRYELQTSTGYALALMPGKADDASRILLEEKRTLEEQLQQITHSMSWKITKPLRYAKAVLRKLKNGYALTKDYANIQR